MALMFGAVSWLVTVASGWVVNLLFASVRGRRGQLAIMLAGMALMFGAVSWLVTVASGWVVN
ncbi:cytochrome C biogenesis protein, partial [Klebsiella pneumoniae]